MHIVLCSRHYPPETGRGGLGTYTRNLAHGLAETGHHVWVVSSSPAATIEERDGRVRVLRFEFRWKNHLFFPQTRNALRYSFGVARSLRRLGRDRKIDVVQCPELLAEGLFASFRRRAPMVIRSAMPLASLGRTNARAWSGGWLRRLDRAWVGWLESWGRRRADLRIAPSSSIADDATIVIPNGTDLDHFRPTSRSAAREKAGIPDEAKIFLYIGPLEYRKGVHLLPAAFREVAERDRNAMLVVAGTDHLSAPGSGSMRRWLEIRLEIEGIEDRALFLGTVSHESLPGVYAMADVLVVPSLVESFGNVVVEAMATGLPIIATLSGGPQEIVRHGETGILVPPNNTTALTSAMCEILLDPEAARDAGHAARHDAVARFDRKLMARRTASVYRNLVESRSDDEISSVHEVRQST